MLVLVTGSTGFIGSHLCRALLEDGHRVRAFRRAQSPLLALEGLPIEHVIGDISDPDSLKRAMPGIQAIFHAAAMLGKPSHPEDMYRITVEGTRNVLAAAMEANVQRLVHTSSVAALGVPDFQVRAISNKRSFKHLTLPQLINENHTWNFSPEPLALWLRQVSGRTGSAIRGRQRAGCTDCQPLPGGGWRRPEPHLRQSDHPRRTAWHPGCHTRRAQCRPYRRCRARTLGCPSSWSHR